MANEMVDETGEHGLPRVLFILNSGPGVNLGS